MPLGKAAGHRLCDREAGLVLLELSERRGHNAGLIGGRAALAASCPSSGLPALTRSSLFESFGFHAQAEEKVNFGTGEWAGV